MFKNSLTLQEQKCWRWDSVRVIFFLFSWCFFYTSIVVKSVQSLYILNITRKSATVKKKLYNDYYGNGKSEVVQSSIIKHKHLKSDQAL